MAKCPTCQGIQYCPCPECANRNNGQIMWKNLPDDIQECGHCGYKTHIDQWCELEMKQIEGESMMQYKEEPYFKTNKQREEFINALFQPIAGIEPQIITIEDGSTAVRYESPEGLSMVFTMTRHQCYYFSISPAVTKAGCMTKDLDLEYVVRRTKEALLNPEHELWLPEEMK